MTWLVGKDRKSLWCAETFSALQFTGTEWKLFGPVDFEGTAIIDADSAMALLAALGHRWDGSAIVPLAPPATPGTLPLAPVDLSQPAKEGCYIVWSSQHEWWQGREMAAGESWQAFGNSKVTHAYGPLPERPQ